MVSLDEAKKLIKLAKEAISAYFEGKETGVSEEIKQKFGERRGVFVSLYVKDELNGCIGFPEPVFPLYKAVVEAARAAAFEDPRFPPLSKGQFKALVVEMSVLSKPEEIVVKSAAEYPKKVKIGVDGLIIRSRRGSGLLLPQVAVEWGWSGSEFLSQTCVKAGLESDAWKSMNKGVYKFHAQIFREEKGKVVEKKLY